MSDKVCLICLDTGSKLYLLSEYNLKGAYENVTGLLLDNVIKFAPTLCNECAHRLINCNRFRDKSLKTHTLLLDLLKNQELLTIENIKAIDRVNNELTSNLVMKVFAPDHCDHYIIEYEQDDKKIEMKNNVHSPVEMKFKKCDNVEPKEENFICINNNQNLYYDNIDYLNDDINCDYLENNYFSNTLNKRDQFNSSELSNVYNVEFVNPDNSAVNITNNKVETKDNVSVICNVNKTKNKKVNSKKVRKKPVKSKIKKPDWSQLKLFKVHALSYEEQVAEVKERQEIASYKKSIYKCTVCFTGFLNKNSYNRHMAKHTNKCGIFTCAFCSIHCVDRRKLITHLKRSHTMRYSCTSCVFVTRHRHSADLHERWHNGAKYKCSQCDEEFKTVSGRLTHLRIKHPSDFICFVCGYSYISKKGITDHMRLAHCFENVENPQGPECVPCNVRFASEAAYNQHMKVSPKHSSDSLRVRNTPRAKYRPQAKQSITCEQCGVQIKDFWAYAWHFKKVHPDKNRTKYSMDNRCLCEQCGKVFKNEALLGYHKATHAGEKLFQCDLCKKRFNYKPQLTFHMKVHSENRPMYECPICKKNFSFKANRDRHIYIHKEKSFKCELCGKAFTTDYERRGHVLHVHLKKPWPKKNRGPKRKAAQITFKEEINASINEAIPDTQ